MKEHRRQLAPLLLVAAGWAGLVFALGMLSPLLPMPWPPLLYVMAFSAVTAATIATASVAPTLGPRVLVPVLLLSLGTLGTLAAVGNDLPPPLQALFVTAALLLGGASLGGAVGGRIEHPGHLLPVVVVSLLVDSFSVFHSTGPTAAIVERPTLIALLALPWPVLGTTDFAPVLGVGDIVFAALYCSAAWKFELGMVRTAIALTVGLLATMVGVLVFATALPALVGMGAAVLIAHPRARKVPPADRRKAWIVIGVMAVLLLGALLRDRTGWF